MPKLEDFPGDEYGYSYIPFYKALETWERVCKEIINASIIVKL